MRQWQVDWATYDAGANQDVFEAEYVNVEGGALVLTNGAFPVSRELVVCFAPGVWQCVIPYVPEEESE